MQIITDKNHYYAVWLQCAPYYVYYITVSVPVQCASDCVYYFTVPVQCAFVCVYYITVSVPV